VNVVRPIDIAVREGHWGAVNEFLEHDPDIRAEGAEILTNQLYEASESGDLEVVRIILKCGISVNSTNNYGNTPLHVAARPGSKEVTRLL
jgi:ankyrin repeat protein